MHNMLFISTFLLFTTAANVRSLSLESLYTNPENKTLPEVIIFHNPASYCPNCKKAIDMIISVLKKNYKNKIRAYIIDEQKHPAFITAFKLKSPLSLVVIRISDGASFGYKKLEGLQSEIYDTLQFSLRVTQFIDNFLSFN